MKQIQIALKPEQLSSFHWIHIQNWYIPVSPIFYDATVTFIHLAHSKLMTIRIIPLFSMVGRATVEAGKFASTSICATLKLEFLKRVELLISI